MAQATQRDVIAHSRREQKIDDRFAALVFDQTELNLGITFLDPLDHIADAAQHVVAAVAKRMKYHPPRPIVVALTLQSEFHETIASLVSAIACRNVWPSKEIGPTWAPEIAPVSVSKNPPQAVRTILLKQRSIHRSPQPSWRSFTQSGRWV